MVLETRIERVIVTVVPLGAEATGRQDCNSLGDDTPDGTQRWGRLPL